MRGTIPNDLITVAAAQRLLGVSRPTMSRLIKGGVIRHFPDPLDRRVKLVSRVEVLALKMPRAEAA